VEIRYFGGLTIEEAAEVMDISEAWLRADLWKTFDRP
jgi:hypothetical protein